MVDKVKKIVWDRKALHSFHAAIEYINRDSERNARKVQGDILQIITSLLNAPARHALDKFKRNNDGTYRAFEKHRYRIVYRVLQTRIKIISIRHTSMEPIEY